MTAMLRSLRRSEFAFPAAITARVETVKDKLADALAIGSVAIGFVMTIVWIGCLAWLATQAIAAVI